MIIDSWKLRLLITKALFSPFIYHLCCRNEFFVNIYPSLQIFISSFWSKSFTLFNCLYAFVYSRCETACPIKKSCNSVLPFLSSAISFTFISEGLIDNFFHRRAHFQHNVKIWNFNTFMVKFSNFKAIKIACQCLYFYCKNVYKVVSY